MTLNLSNPYGVLTPQSVIDAFYINNLLQIERGFYVDGQPEYCKLGIFSLSKPVTSVTTQGTTLTVYGQDLMKRGYRASYGESGYYAAGTSLEALVQDMAVRLGLPLRYNTSYGSLWVLGEDLPYSLGDNIRDLVLKTADAFGAEVYLDEDAYLTISPLPTDGSLPAPSWTLERGQRATIVRVDRSLEDDPVYNHVVVVGESAALNIGSTPHVPFGEARDTNPDSPYYHPEEGTGECRMYVTSDATITTDAQASQVAEALLFDLELVQEDLVIASTPLPFLVPGDVITVTDSAAGVDDEYLIDSIEHPIGSGQTRISATAMWALS